MMKRENPLLDKLTAVLPAIADMAVQAEKDRTPNPKAVELIKSTGFHRAFQPKKYGGLEISLPEFADCVAALAGACGGTAWAISLLATHSHQMAMFSAKAQEEFWGENPNATASSSIAPFGKTEEIEGGVLFNGEMAWSSGCEHADWAIVGFLRLNDQGEKSYSFGVIPRSEYDIKDTWFAAGMRASGTNTLIIKDIFIPNHRIQAAKDMMEGKSDGFGLYPESKIFYTPYRPYFACGFSAISLGIAERMLTVYKEKTKNRVRAYTGVNVGTATPALMRLAESTHQVAAARAFLEKTWDEHAEYGANKQYPTREELAFWRTNQAYAIKMCIAAVDRMFEAMGGACWVGDNEAQRLFRDSHMTGAHAYTDYDVCSQILGRELMGLEPDPSMV